jgi:hypothetical protein
LFWQGEVAALRRYLLGRSLSIVPFFISLLVPFICFSYGSSFFILCSKGSCGGGGSPSSALLLLLLLLPLLLQCTSYGAYTRSGLRCKQ